MLTRIHTFLSKRSHGTIFLLAYVLILLLGVADYLTGTTYSIAIAYLIPIVPVARYIRNRSGVIIAVIAVFVSVVSDWIRSLDVASLPPLIWSALVYLAFILIIVRILSKLREEEEKVEEWAAEDALTGVANSKAFFQAAETEMHRSQRYGGPFSVGCIRINNFAAATEAFGAESGGVLLSHVATTIRRNTRNIDVVARTGDTDFAVLLPETEADDAKQTLAKVQKHLVRAAAAAGWPVTFALGAVAFAKPPASFEELRAKVDKVIFSVKRSSTEMKMETIKE